LEKNNLISSSFRLLAGSCIYNSFVNTVVLFLPSFFEIYNALSALLIYQTNYRLTTYKLRIIYKESRNTGKDYS